MVLFPTIITQKQPKYEQKHNFNFERFPFVYIGKTSDIVRVSVIIS